jgi:hypothetical protein
MPSAGWSGMGQGERGAAGLRCCVNVGVDAELETLLLPLQGHGTQQQQLAPNDRAEAPPCPGPWHVRRGEVMGVGIDVSKRLLSYTRQSWVQRPNATLGSRSWVWRVASRDAGLTGRKF